MFYWTRFDGILEVYIDGVDVVPNQSSETTQAWLSAIKSLEQRGYISGEGLKAGVFELTNEGRMAARKLSGTVPPSGTQDPDESNAPILDAENE
ncbi:hypothetical protein [Stieleria varia]|nr:hypothetical protein [Stieleria varia]